MWSTVIYIVLLILGIVGIAYYLYNGIRNKKLKEDCPLFLADTDHHRSHVGHQLYCQRRCWGMGYHIMATHGVLSAGFH